MVTLRDTRTFRVLIYVALVVICCLTTLSMLTDLVDRYRVRNASLEMLSRLEGRDQFCPKMAGRVDHRSWKGKR